MKRLEIGSEPWITACTGGPQMEGGCPSQSTVRREVENPTWIDGANSGSAKVRDRMFRTHALRTEGGDRSPESAHRRRCHPEAEASRKREP